MQSHCPLQAFYSQSSLSLYDILLDHPAIKEYFEIKYKKNVVVPIYIEITDKERMHRAIIREDSQESPKYKELCRRYLADDIDFSEDLLSEANIKRRFSNMNGDNCFKEICEFIQEII